MQPEQTLPKKKGNKFVLVVIIVILILLAVVIYWFIYGSRIKSFDISPGDQACQTDDDCVFVFTKCACDCGSPVNIIHRVKYEEQWQEMCENYKGSRCSMVCNFVAQCVNGSCVAVAEDSTANYQNTNTGETEKSINSTPTLNQNTNTTAININSSTNTNTQVSNTNSSTNTNSADQQRYEDLQEEHQQYNSSLTDNLNAAAVAVMSSEWTEAKQYSQDAISIFQQWIEIDNNLIILANQLGYESDAAKFAKRIEWNQANIEFYEKGIECADYKIAEDEQSYAVCDAESLEIYDRASILMEEWSSMEYE